MSAPAYPLSRDRRPGGAGRGAARQRGRARRRRRARARRARHGEVDGRARPGAAAAAGRRGRGRAVRLRPRRARARRRGARRCRASPSAPPRSWSCRSAPRWTGSSARSTWARALGRRAAPSSPGCSPARTAGSSTSTRSTCCPTTSSTRCSTPPRPAVARVEREAVSVEHDARFLLVGTMNVEEGELRPQLLDRFGLGVEVARARRPRRCAPRSSAAGWPSSADPRGVRARAGRDEERALAARIADARGAAARRSRLPERELLRITRRLREARGRRRARRHRQRARRPRPRRARRRRARSPRSTCAAPPRSRSPTAAAATRSTATCRPPSDLDRALDDEPEPATRRRRSPAGAAARRARLAPSPGAANGVLDARDRAPPGAVDAGGEAPYAPSAPARAAQRRRAARAARRRGRCAAARRAAAARSGRRARTAGRGAGSIDSRPARAGLATTSRSSPACAPGCSATIAHLREHVRAGREGALLCLVVDASGSMGAQRRLARVKGALAGLLRDAYARRDRVAVVAFRDDDARGPDRARRAARARRRRAAPRCRPAGARRSPPGCAPPSCSSAARRCATRPAARSPSCSPTAASATPRARSRAAAAALGRAADGGRGRRHRGGAGAPRPRARARRRGRRPRPPARPRHRAFEEGRMSTESPLARHGADGVDVPHRPGDRGSAEPKRRKPRDRPLVIVVTGTARARARRPSGCCMRSWARGYRCGVFQFVKSGKWKVGEAKAAAALGGIDWEKMGDGWSWLSKDLDESADLAREGWDEVKRAIAAGALRVPAARRDHLPDQVGLDRRRRGRRDAPRSSRLPARRHHRPRRRARADRAGRPRLRGRQGQAPDGRGDPRPAGDRVVDVLVILDGASEPLGAGARPRWSARARRRSTRSAREGALSRLRTIAARAARGLRGGDTRAAGLGAAGAGRPRRARGRRSRDRAGVRASAPGASTSLGADGRRAGAGETARAATSLAAEAPAHVVRRIGGHRLLITGAPPLPAAARAAGLHAWPRGRRPATRSSTTHVVVIAAARRRGRAVRGCSARAWSIPPGATGGPDTDLRGQGGRRARRDRRRRTAGRRARGRRRRGGARTRRGGEGRRARADRRASWSRRSRARSARRTARSRSAPTTAATPSRARTTTTPSRACAGRTRAGPRGRLTERAGARAGRRGARRGGGRVIARIVVAGTSSGAGKTTVACGLIGALRAPRARRAGLQGRPRLHRPELPRARLGPARAATSTRSSAAPS